MVKPVDAEPTTAGAKDAPTAEVPVGIALASAPLTGFGPAFAPGPLRVRVSMPLARVTGRTDETLGLRGAGTPRAELKAQLMAALARQLGALAGIPATLEGRCRFVEQPQRFACDDAAAEDGLTPASAALQELARQLAAVDAEAGAPQLAYADGRFEPRWP